jgi:hypothetical protein
MVPTAGGDICCKESAKQKKFQKFLDLVWKFSLLSIPRERFRKDNFQPD